MISYYIVHENLNGNVPGLKARNITAQGVALGQIVLPPQQALKARNNIERIAN